MLDVKRYSVLTSLKQFVIAATAESAENTGSEGCPSRLFHFYIPYSHRFTTFQHALQSVVFIDIDGQGHINPCMTFTFSRAPAKIRAPAVAITRDVKLSRTADRFNIRQTD